MCVLCNISPDLVYKCKLLCPILHYCASTTVYIQFKMRKRSAPLQRRQETSLAVVDGAFSLKNVLKQSFAADVCSYNKTRAKPDSCQMNKIKPALFICQTHET